MRPGVFVFSLAALLFAVNAYVCRELFAIEYSRYMGSIEGAYIGISRYMLAHWGDLSWFPGWYGGIPAQNTYPPLLHWLAALAAFLRGISPALAYHWVTAIFYCLGPVTLFALALRLTKSPWAAFCSGMLYSALSPSEWFMPAIAQDGGQWHPERLRDLINYGEGPHVAALTLVPLALLLLDLALTRKRIGYSISAAAAFAAVALTNWIGAVALALGVAAYLFTTRSRRDFGRLLLIAAAAYGMAMPWIPPSTIAAVHANSQLIGGDYRHTGAEMLRWIPAAFAVLVILARLLRRVPRDIQFAAYFAILTALPGLAVAWGHIAIVPQPERYHLEMELALALLAGTLFNAGVRRLPRRCAVLVAAAVVLALIWPIKIYRHYARKDLMLPIQIRNTSEWRTAQWLKQHWKGGRVLLPGSTGFWLSAFSDTPELGGGFDQGVTIPVYLMAKYEIASGDAAGTHAADIALLWFKALGVQALDVTEPGGTEVFKDSRNPHEFDGILQPLWRDSGDVLYRVGTGSSLAHVMARGDLVSRTPMNGIDVAPLRTYVAALDSPLYPRAAFGWTSLHSARIQADLPPNGVVSVQVSWSAGWHARVNGTTIPVYKDGLGFLYIVPGTTGPTSILITYDGGTEMKLARAICWATWIALPVAAMFMARKERTDTGPPEAPSA